MPSAKLTIRTVKAARYEGDGSSRHVIWDTDLQGFGLRIYPSGRKAFIISYRAQGRKRMMVIGGFGTFTVDQARDRAGKKLRMVRDGKDPMEEDRKAAQGKTFGELKEKYIEEHAKVHKKSWQKDERQLKAEIPKSWDSRLAVSITRGEISTIHAKLGLKHPYGANRLLEVLRKMFNLARIWEFPGFDDASKPNPATDITRFPEYQRKRFVEKHELRPLAKAIDQEPNIFVRAAIWLYILTGVRRSELLTATWEQVEWKTRQLRLPETKSGEEQFVALSGPAIGVLQAIPRMEGNPYILPGSKKGGHLVNIGHFWRRIRKDAGIEDVRLHDLRRTVGSWMSQSNVDLNKIKDALRHADIATTLIYARLGEDPARDAMEDHGRNILEAAGDHGPLKVLEGGKGGK